MKNIKAAIRRNIKDYHQLQQTIVKLNIQRGSPTVLSSKAWYQREMTYMLAEEGIPQEEVPALVHELLNEELGLEEKIAIYEKKVFPHKKR